jgi:hypothetical protein
VIIEIICLRVTFDIKAKLSSIEYVDYCNLERGDHRHTSTAVVIHTCITQLTTYSTKLSTL